MYMIMINQIKIYVRFTINVDNLLQGERRNKDIREESPGIKVCVYSIEYRYSQTIVK